MGMFMPCLLEPATCVGAILFLDVCCELAAFLAGAFFLAADVLAGVFFAGIGMLMPGIFIWATAGTEGANRMAVVPSIKRGNFKKSTFCVAESPLASPRMTPNEVQQLQFLQVQGLQRQAAPFAHPQLSVLRSSTLLISNLLFFVAQ